MSHHALAICRVALAGIPLVRQKDTDRHVGEGFMARQWVCHWSFWLFPKALRRVLPENLLNTDTSTLTLEH